MVKEYYKLSLVESQICTNCKSKMIADLHLMENLIGLEDVQGIPALFMRCPICGTKQEWECTAN